MAVTDKRTQLYLTAQQHAAVQRIAQRRGLSMAGVVREALATYLTSALTQQSSDGDPLADLVGIFDGPGDLAERHDEYLDTPKDRRGAAKRPRRSR